MASRVSLFILLGFLVMFKNCNNDTGSSPPPGFQPTQSIQDGLNAYDSYYNYYQQYTQAPESPKPNPIDPLQVSIAALTVPGFAQTVVPTPLSTELQKDFQTIISQVPASHATQVKGLSLKMTSCSSGDPVLWSGLQTGGSGGGSICVSPRIIREVFIYLTSTPATNLFKDLLKYDDPDPFTFNGDSNAVIQSFASKTPGKYTKDDIQALVFVVNSDVNGVGGYIPTFKDCIDYLIAREVVEVYSGTTDEAIISASASSLLKQNGSTHLDLSPLSTLFLPAAIQSSGATNWGVSKVGDGQQVLNGISGLGGTTKQ